MISDTDATTKVTKTSMNLDRDIDILKELGVKPDR
jgi:hypothetical protein